MIIKYHHNDKILYIYIYIMECIKYNKKMRKFVNNIV